MSLQTFPYVWKANDTLPELFASKPDLDLTGYTVTLHLRRPDGTTVTKTGVITDAAGGQFKFKFDAGDLVAGDCQLAEVQFVNPSTDITTSEQFYVNVAEEVA